MSLISRAIANLLNGVSQQAPTLRAPNQCELQENVYSTLARGARKRPPTVHVAKLSATASSSAFIHWINRDAAERYEVRIRNGAIEVYNILTGAAQTVNTPSGVAYLTSSDPSTDFAAVTVADFTFIVNRSIKAAMLPDRFGKTIAAVAVSSITRAGQTATVTTGAVHNLTTGDWVRISGAVQTEYNGWFQVTVTGGTTFTYAVTGSPATPATGSPSYIAVKGAVDGSVQAFANLPAASSSLAIREVAGDGSNSFGAYYVQDQSGNVYREVLKPGLQYKLDPSTMPHRLVRTSAGVFSFEQASWGDRGAGDDTTAPLPSFVGYPLNDVFFHRNRLGVLSRDNAILGEAGQYFNMFTTTVTAVVDSDPIDRSATTTNVTLLKSAVSFNSALYILGDTGQFQMVGGVDASLTPRNSKLVQVTQYEADGFVKPASAGTTLFFPTPQTGFSAIREFYVDSEAVNGDASDITAHVPQYIEGSVRRMTCSTTQDCLAVLSRTNGQRMWVYKFFYENSTSKLQSSWSQFVFDADTALVGCEWYGTRLYIAADSSDGHHLYYMDVQPGLADTTLPFLVYLDRRVSLTGVYDAANDWTTWTLPYAFAGTVQAVRTGSWAVDKGAVIDSLTRPSSTTVRRTGNLSAQPVFIGVPYTARYRFSRLFLKDNNNVSISGAILKLRTLLINFDDTAYFRVEVTPQGRATTFKYPYTNKVLNTPLAAIGGSVPSDGEFRVPVVADSREVTIDLVNDSYLPSAWQSAAWEAEYTNRSRRV